MQTTTNDIVSTINPATGHVLSEYRIDDTARAEAILQTAHDGFLSWRRQPIGQRAQVLRQLATQLHTERERLAWLISVEMGKPLRQAEAEIDKCVRLAEWMALHGPATLADEPAPVEEAQAYVSFLPLGVILGIMPWNFPFWQVLRAAVPIVLSGNSFLLKHAPNVLGCAYALKELFERAGAPKGAFATINVDNETIDAMLHDNRIAAVTLTGSVRAGAAVAAIAGGVTKKSLLELGGSDPFIVLKDADLDDAVEKAIIGRYQNTGQVCLAAKRFIVEAPIAAAFTERFVAAAVRLKIGDPLDPKTDLGPIARDDLRDGLHEQVEATLREGAQLLLGGRKCPGDGFFYEPTVLAGVRPGMTAFRDEIFGPVAAITVADNVEDAISLANDSQFGLGGSVWTRDIDSARAVARRLETGAVFINGYTVTDPRVPVGGIRRSGYGRELSHFGLREFVNAQTVWISQNL